MYKEEKISLYSVFLNYHEHQYNTTPWFRMVVFSNEVLDSITGFVIYGIFQVQNWGFFESFRNE